jgi:hypothetical protein
MTDKENTDRETNAAHDIIQLFGGIRPMAGKLGVAVSTVQGWKERDTIPRSRHAEILAAAKEHGLELAEEALGKAGESAPSGAGAPRAERAAPKTAAAAGNEKPGSGAGPAATSKADPPAEPAPKDRPTSPLAAAATPRPTAGASPGAGPTPRASSPPRAAPPPSTTGPAAGGGSRVGAFVLGAVVFAVGAGGAVLSRDAWLPYVGGPPAASGGEATGAVTAELKDLADRTQSAIGRLEGELDGLATAVQTLKSPDGQSDDLVAMQEQMAGVASRLKGLEAKLDNRPVVSPEDLAALSGDQAALAKRLEELEGLRSDLAAQGATLAAINDELAGVRGAVNGDTTLLLAGLQLRDAVRFDAPFAKEHATMAGLAGDDPEFAKALAEIAPFAAAGVPSVESLRESFPDMAAEVVAAQRASEVGEGWLSGAVKRVSNLVSFRPVGAVDGDGPGAAAARAEVHLDGGDLAGAVAELEGLSGDGAAAATDWIAQAKSRIAVDGALDELAAVMARRLGLAGG